MTYNEGFLYVKSHDCLITWSCEVTLGGVTYYSHYQAFRRVFLIKGAIFFKKEHLQRRLKQLHFEKDPGYNTSILDNKIRGSFALKSLYIKEV